MNDLNKVILQIAGGDMKEPTLEEKLQKEYDDEVNWLVERYEADPEMTVLAIYETVGQLLKEEKTSLHRIISVKDAKYVGSIVIGWVDTYIRDCAESEARGE